MVRVRVSRHTLLKGPTMSGSENPVNNTKYYGDNSKNLFLPFYRPVRLPPAPSEVPIIPSLVAEACGTKVITGYMT